MRADGRGWGLYVHVPWCRVRCPYCAFHVDPDRGDVPWSTYVDRVLADVDRLRADFPGEPETVYLGGGTPSRLPPAELARLLRAFPRPAETTVEANPEDVDDPWIAAALAAGVDRVSLGVQTLDVDQGRRLGRAHTPPEARRAAARLVAHGVRSWSIDLMFALPGQTLDALRADLDALLALDPPHVSLYGLTLEPGTPFARAAGRGRLAVPDEDLWRTMYDTIVDALGAAGLVRYEVSNFARQGHESHHNRGYWEDRPYLGVGPSAHGYAPDGRRWVDVADTAAWLSGAEPVRTWESPTPHQAAVDRLVSGLRGREGLDLDTLAARTGLRPSDLACRQLVGARLLEQDGAHVRLGPEGWHVADGVVEALVRGLVPVDRGASAG